MSASRKRGVAVLVFALAATGAFVWSPAPSTHAAYNASFVLGQPNFTSNGATTTQNGLNYPYGVAYDSVNQRLFVAECNNNRILVFNVATNTIANNENASFVLGQSNFTSSTIATTQSGMNCPQGPAYDSVNQRLFIADTGNQRVLVFNVAPGTIANNENASFVLGQSSFFLSTAATSQTGMRNPARLAYDSATGRLFNADNANHRVTVFDVNPATIANNENASFVLGQSTFSARVATTTQNGMNFPAGVAYDGATGRLFVTDDFNNRILVFSAASGTLANNENASFVLGQSNFTSSTATTTQSGLNVPEDAAYDPINNRLYTSERTTAGNNRVTIFSAATSTLANGASATNVLGQSTFTSKTPTTTQSGMNDAEGIAFDSVNNRLFVCDATNNRVLVYNFVSITTTGSFTGQNGVPFTQTVNTTSSQGTVSLLVSSGTLPYSTSGTTISGTATTTGTFNFSLTASDDNGTIGAFPSFPVSFTLTITNPSPTTTSLSPTSTPAGVSSFTLTVNGTNFVTSSTVNWNGSALATTYVSSTVLTATVPAGNVASQSTSSVTVVNPAPGGGTSNAQTFTITNPAPVTTSLSPTSTVAGTSTFALTVNGSNFIASSTVNWNGSPLVTTFTSPTVLTATVPATNVTTEGTSSVTVVNPAPGGGTSNAQTFTATAVPAPPAPTSTQNPPTVSVSAGGPLISAPPPPSIPSIAPAVPAEAQQATAGEEAQAQAAAEIKALRAKTVTLLQKAPWLDKSHSYGERGDDVVFLQFFLIIRDTGPAARALLPRGATGYFGPLTVNALAEFQSAAGISPARGNFGPKTRAYIRSFTP